MSERAWTFLRASWLVVVVVLLSPISPVLLLLIPMALMTLAFRFREAMLALVAVLVLLFVFRGGSEASNAGWMATRAWCLLLGGAFVVITMAQRHRSTLTRAMSASALAGGAVFVTGMVRPGSLAELDWWMGTEIRSAADLAVGMFESVLGQGGDSGERLSETFRQVVEFQQDTYPALLALASVAALSLGWFLVHRSRAGSREMTAVRHFRFSNHLVWVLIAGLALIVFPTGALADRVGQNATLFMGALYLLRGMAILIWMAAASVSSAWAALALSAVAMLLYPIVAGTALVLGLTDTWVDVRRRLSSARNRDSYDGPE
ncbi:MAG: DUF2232 domain-containing protein [Gemmatimonadota bacterium]